MPDLPAEPADESTPSEPASSDDASTARSPAAEESAGSRRTGRRVQLAGWGVLVLLVLGLAWIVVTGLIARSHLDEARAKLGSLRAAVVAGDTTKVDALVATIRDDTASAHALTSGPAWWVAANLPVAGEPLQTVRVLATQAHRLGSEVLPGVARLTTTVREAARSSATSIDLDAVDRAAPELRRAAAAAARASVVVDETPGSWLGPVSSARDSFARQLVQLRGELSGADRAVGILRPMLGEHGTQRYFVGFLNEAEARGGGGIPGAFAIVTADRGRISFEKFGTDEDLKGVRARVDLGGDFAARYLGNDPLGTIQNSNLSPDFGYAGRIWAGMWQAKTGERVDGALAIDPTALSYLLDVTGPVTAPDGTRITAGNVVSLTQQQQYVRFAGTSRTVSQERKQFLTGLAQAISTHLTGAVSEPTRMIKALSRAAGERRLVVWSRYSTVEAALREADWAGQLGNDEPAPYSGFVVNNAAGSKLDYYLDRAMTYRRSSCDNGATAIATLRLTNDAPRRGLPAYVTIRADGAPAGARLGDNSLLVTYYADRAASIRSLTVNGRSRSFTVQPEGDTIAVTTTVELPVGRPLTLQVTVREPAARGPVTVLRQPLVRPLYLDLRGDRCARTGTSDR